MLSKYYPLRLLILYEMPFSLSNSLKRAILSFCSVSDMIESIDVFFLIFLKEEINTTINTPILINDENNLSTELNCIRVYLFFSFQIVLSVR